MTDLTALKRKRGTVKAALTRVETALMAIDRITPQEAQIRLRKIEEIWADFGKTQEKIEEEEPEDDDENTKFQEENENERVQFEQKYYTLATKLQKIIDEEANRIEDHRRQAAYNQNQNAQVNQAFVGEQAPGLVRVETTHIQRNRPRLPEMKMPEFDGNWTKWVFFRNYCETAIYNDDDIKPMQKQQYLLGALKGEALNVVEGFEINENNATIVWQLLKDTYNNEMMIIESHLDQLINFPSISKDNKAQSMKNMIFHIQTHVQSLKSLSQPVDTWDTIIIHLAKKKLDYTELKEWQEKVKNKTPQDMPKLTEFIKFLTDRCHTLRMLGQVNDKATGNTALNTERIKPFRRDRKTEGNVLLGLETNGCKICSAEHQVFQCEELLKLNTKDRKKLIIENKLCLNCLKSGHLGRDCYSSGCRKCGEKHNTLLHLERSENADIKGEKSQVHCCTGAEQNAAPPTIMYCTKGSSQVILSTAQIYIHRTNGEKVMCRALLDPGSQINLITQELIKKLKIPSVRSSRTVSVVNQGQINSSKVVNVKISSKTGTFNTELECVVFPSITEELPQTRIDSNEIMVPSGVMVADTGFNEPGKIDVLIGAGLYWKLIKGAPQNQIQGQPAWQDTQLGWIVGGEISKINASKTASCFKVTNADLNQQLEKFWLQETIPQDQKYYTKEEQCCEKYFQDTTTRDQTGRFTVRLPFRSGVTLGESKQQALKRLYSIERKFSRNPELAEAYGAFMEDYLKQQHMTLKNTTARETEECYFIPHQAVIRPDSITTKVRVVFDASAKTTQGTSLNDKLLPGPNLQGDLFKILVKFRTHEVVLTGDIKQMYRQIMIHPEDRRYQMILWRKDPQEEPQGYELNTVTYGTACAPFHALRCLRELAQLHKEEYPLAANAIENGFYMDDCLSGGRTEAAAEMLYMQLNQLLQKGQFDMRKWRSNNESLIRRIGQGTQHSDLLILDGDEAMKTLGLLWNSRQDTLQYQVSSTETSINTKRMILSKISQIFDPLGLISSVLINGKLLMQKLWASELDWDDQLPEEYSAQWRDYHLSLPKLNDLMIGRNVNPGNISTQVDLYGFGDASERAFGACVYTASENESGETEVHLLCSKSKVAPLKTISLPRLELEAALLLSQLVQVVRSALPNNIRSIFLWSDSTIVLGWLRTEPSLLKTFVANRVSKIQELTEGLSWSHVISEENPADLASRGTTVEQLIENSLWWHGPSWIKNPAGRPVTVAEPESNLPEMKVTEVTLTITKSFDVFTKFSSFRRLCRVIAYCKRFIDNCREPKLEIERKTEQLQLTELKKAEEMILYAVQLEMFPQERRCLEANSILPKKSPLRPLKVFISTDGLLRVGGRLTNAQLPEEEKHPVILPAKHHVTRIIMEEEHQRLKHCPPNQLLHSLRQRFWPLNARREIRAVVKRCLPCFRFKPDIPETLMGDLPAVRVEAYTRPFSTSGVDYAGPFQVRESRRRGRVHISKAYVALFVCFSTKAVHLELVSDLTSEAFLAALSRFTARRGICSRLYSDNGTNFTGASRELQEIYEFLRAEQKTIEAELEKQRIEWHFIPPRAPHFGGLWESAVKSMKRHLLTVTQGKILTFEEYATLLSEVEAILNSRPLTPLSNDPTDLTVLTPSHFLTGDIMIQPVQNNWLEVSDNRLSRWQKLQKFRQILWKRWTREYLQELQTRTKWCDPGTEIVPDTLVLIMDECVSPLHWPMGRVTDVHPGRDGITRVVTVRTATGTLTRPIRKVCPIPSSEDQD